MDTKIKEVKKLIGLFIAFLFFIGIIFAVSVLSIILLTATVIGFSFTIALLALESKEKPWWEKIGVKKKRDAIILFVVIGFACFVMGILFLSSQGMISYPLPY